MNDFAKYEALKARVLELLAEGKLPRVPTLEQLIDFVYGNTKIENDDITLEMVEQAVDASRR